jgi:hypothetical protein
MSDWPSLLRMPEDLAAPGRADAWFAVVAERLLNGAELVVARQPHRLVEIEFYLHGADHPDPFTHREPIQLECGRWYFHRTRGAYRSGSFKGIDLTFGNGTAFGGILFRCLAMPDGVVIDGPSLCVDHLLDAAGADTVAALDRAIGKRVAWDTDNPLSLRHVTPERRELLGTPRVGLSLKRAKAVGEMTRFVMAPYRFLSEPRKVGKGKPHMVLAMHARGDDQETIHRVTGCPKASIRRYVEDFEEGRRDRDFSAYFGVDAGPKDWCRLYGVWRRTYGTV